MVRAYSFTDVYELSQYLVDHTNVMKAASELQGGFGRAATNANSH